MVNCKCDIGLEAVRPGQVIPMWQGDNARHAKVLAVLGSEALIEYHGNNHTSLRIIARYHYRDKKPGWPYQNISYGKLQKRWLLELARDDISWTGLPIRGAKLPHRSPREQFLDRWPQEEWRLYVPRQMEEGPTPAQMSEQRRATDRIRRRL